MDWKFVYLGAFVFISVTCTRETSGGITSLKRILLMPDGFNFTEGYDKDDPPVPANNKPIDMNISMLIREISEVNEHNYGVTLTMFLREYWEENRLILNPSAFANLTKDQPMMMDASMINKFWLPDIHIWNMKSFRVHQVHRKMESLQVFRNKTVRHSTACDITIVCPMDYAMYPLDIQLCVLEITSYSLGEGILTFNWKDDPPVKTDVKWNQLPQFTVFVKADPVPYTKTPGIAAYRFLRLQLLFRRNIQPFVLETYLPSGLFVCISWISFIINPDIVPGRMVLLVTVLLTLVTLYSSVRSTSPRTTSLKSIEVWLIVCILFVFTALLEYAVILLILFRHKIHTSKSTGEVVNGHVMAPACEGEKNALVLTNIKSKASKDSRDGDDALTLHLRKYTKRKSSLDVTFVEDSTLKAPKDENESLASSAVSRAATNLAKPGATTDEVSGVAASKTPMVLFRVMFLDRVSLLLFPAMFAIANVAYWTFSLTQRFSELKTHNFTVDYIR